MSNLDDFFKKRDKKKKTTKTKFPTLDTDEFAKKLEATSIVNTELVDEAGETVDGEISSNVVASSGPAASVGGGADHLDEDWKPFDSDENRDYSGLRINIQNWKSEDQDNYNEGGLDDNEKKTNCPWAAAASRKKEDERLENESGESTDKPQNEKPANQQETNETTASNTEDKTEAKPESSSATAASATSTAGGAYVPPALRRKMEEADKGSASAGAGADVKTETSASSNKYVPPSMRNRQNDTSSAIPTTSVNYRRPNKSQPNINDTSEFPTLDMGGEVNPSDKLANGSDEKFEMPKKSGKVEQKATGGMIDLENKFNALSASNN